jgi:uncharacterized protein YjbJ (UPF0337 family)
MCDSAYVGIRRLRLLPDVGIGHSDYTFRVLSLTRRREFRRTGIRASIGKEIEMNKDQKDGVVNQVKGKVNEAVGKVPGDKAREAKGDMKQAAGKVQKGVGDARENIKNAFKTP